MAYDKHTWSTKEAITKSKMQHIEDGIEAASNKADANETNISTLNNKVGNIDVNNGGSISQRLSSMSGDIQTLKNTNVGALSARLESVENQVNAARGDTEPRPNLAQVLADMRSETARVEREYKSADTTINSNITTAQNTADAAISALNLAKGNSESVADRIAAIETVNRTQDTDISTLKGRMNTPITGDTKSVEQHLSSLHTDVDTIQSEIETARGVDNLNVARQNLNARFVDEETRLSNVEGRLVTLETSTGTTIPNRIGAVEGRVSTAEGKITSIESELTSAKDTYDSIDARFDEVEATANAAAVAATVNTALDGLDGRLNAIDGGSALDTTNGTLASRVSAAESAISHAVDAGNSDPGGLTERLTAAETAIGTKANSSDMETALAAKANTADVNTALAVKADTAIVNAISTTIVKAKNDVAYTNNVPSTTQTWTINDKDDYLLQAANDKYYYWKHINNEWHLMGGAGNGEGGGGTGNSDSENYTTYAAFEEAQKKDNKDYYVLQDDNLWHHYRYIASAGENDTVVYTRIEIGQIIDTNKIKRYNMEKVYDEDEKKYYLKVYQYDYNENNNDIDTDLSDILPWKPSTTYSVDAQVVYNDGYVYRCIVANSDAEWIANNWEKISNICTIQFIELPEGGGGGASAGIVKRLTRIGDQTIETITNNQILLEAFYSYHTTELDDNGALIPTESSSGTYVLRSGNTVIETGTVPSGAYKATNIQPGDPGYMQFDVTKYCNIGNTTFELVVTTEGTQQTKNWTVRVIDLHLESEAPEVLLISSSEAYNFPYAAFGALTKTLHVIIDDDTEHEITATLTSITSGRTATVTIPAQEHGAHSIDMYLEATVGGVRRTTEHLIREYIWYDDEVGTTILASPYNEQTITAQQYSTIEIPYQVYKKNASIIDVEYYLDQNATPFGSVRLDNTNTGLLTYLATDKGEHSITIKVDDITITTSLNITQLDINISPVEGAIIDFNPTTLENSSTNRLPSWTVGQNQYSFIDSNNFNWSEDSNGGGYKREEDGKALVIKAGTYINLNYPIFANNILTQGAELKIIYKTKAVRKADAIWLSSVDKMYNKDVGLQLGAHSGWLKTTRAVNENVEIEPDENGVIAMNGINYNIWKPNTAYAVNDIVVLWDESDEDNHQLIFKCLKAWDNTHDSFLNSKGKVDTESWLSVGKISANIAATDSYLYLSYSEQDKIELDINIDAAAQFIMSYEDGVPSKVYAYSIGTGGDGLTHTNTIHIGSDDCDVYLYGLRIYNKSLTTAEILQNFIADGRDVNEKIDRYNRNCIYWDPTQNDGEGGYFPSPSPTATLDPIKLAEVMPNVKVLMLDTPVFTTSKKDFIMNSTLRCIHATGGNVYTSRGDADNWLFTNGFHSGQGTTSDNYGQSARNVDFLFEVDAKHWPTKSKNMGTYKVKDNPDYKSTVYIGKDASAWNEETKTWVPTREPEAIEVCEDWKGDNCKVSLTETSVPNNYFNLKVNVASSENVNNALFQKRYDDFLVYSSPAQTNQIAEHRLNYQALGQDVSKIKVKNSMEFVPAVLFVRENQQDENGNPLNHVEFNDCDWHFYALGNIGDSKKTDYTRAYDPEDINEFTCENSDNNTNNGQFQSGVFNYNGHEAIETDYRAWSTTDEYVENDIVINDGIIYKCAVANATTGTWENNQWTAIIYTNWTETNSAPYFAPRTNPNSMEYIFPINPSQWNVQLDGEYLNRKHKTLIKEKFDGNHSFEFRYACCGDYRDGDLINDTNGDSTVPNTDPETMAKKPFLTKDDVQEKLNHDVMLAFYEWVITSTPEQYQAEASQWFVKSAMEFFYAYTHYYTMMDNRAKNTFWHFAKTGTYIEVSRPVKELLHVYEESSDNGITWSPATGTEIDSNKKYRTQYAFDMWAYDMDTAAGIDNNGQLSFPYGKEDDDYRVDGVPTSGYAFNGAGSIFWRRLKTVFASEIADVMNTAQRCFRAEDLINEFDRFQNCFPEEIWRLDIERKYVRTFTGASIDDSITVGKKNPRFLTAMMQGRKKYQRRQWIRNQSLYFNSKYRLSDITIASNTTEFNVITPANANDPNIAVKPNYDLKLVPYQDMYINVTVGNGGPTPSQRVKAGETYILPIADYTSANFGETRIYIYGFSGISEIGNLASMYPYSFTLNALDHLKKLDMGTDASGYVNANLTSLPFTTDTELPLLESINIKNCHSLSGGLNLNRANNLRTVEATGTTITGINLPQYTQIETLHLPSTVTDLVLYGAKKLDDLQIINNNTGLVDYSGLFNLNIYDSDYSSNIDWMSIANSIIEKQSLETNISLLRLSNATIVDIESLEPFKEFKTILENKGNTLELSGTINVTGDWSQIEKDTYKTIWPDLTLNTTNGSEVSKVLVSYVNRGYQSDTEWIPEQEITTRYITVGDPIPDIYSNVSVSELPTRDATIASVFQFGTINQSTYRVYSGWTLSKTGDNPVSLYTQGYTNNNPYRASASMNGKVSLYTLFNATPHKYTVNWYLDSSTLIKSESNQDYGGGYDLEAPTVKDIRENYETIKDFHINSDNTVTYSIFDGWQKLPTNINPTLEEAKNSVYNIYAKWYTNTVSIDEAAENGLFSDTTSPSLEQLLVFSRMSNTDRNSYPKSKTIVKNKKFNYQMGFNGTNNNGTVIVNTNAVQTFTSDNAGNSIAFNNIKPFSTNNGFTLAIDYQFDDTQQISTDAAILMGCYDKVNGNITGFALYNNTKSEHGPTGAVVGYGNMFSIQDNTKSVGVLGQRNMLVIRHPANSSRLWIYSSRNTNSASLEQDYIPTYIDLTTQTLSENAVLCLGHLRTDINTNSNFSNEEGINTTGAQGTIYWLKYWDEDLGAGECQQLAQWPHENMTSIITAVSDDFTQEVNGNIRPALYFMGLNNSSHGMTNSARFDRSEGTNVGWNNSAMKTICDERIFNGLPIRLQSILSNIRVGHFNYLAQYNTSTESMGYALSNLQTSTGYVYLPSISSLTFNVATYNNESIYERNGKTTGTLVTDITPYSLYEDAASMAVYDYYNTGTRWREASAESAYYNLRFTNKPISWSTSSPLRIYRIARSAIPSGSTLRNLIPNLESGDIVVLTNEAAYMYVSTDDLSYGLQPEPQTDIFNTAIGSVTEGGWIRSQSYITRSVTASSSQYNNFIYINALGVPVIPDNSNSQPGLINLDYAFTI